MISLPRVPEYSPKFADVRKYMAKNKRYRKTHGPGRGLLWRLFEFLILAAVVWLAFILAGRSLRQVAVTQLAGLTNAKIKAESIDFNFDGSVTIDKLVIRPEQEDNDDAAILKAEKVYAQFDLGSLVLVRPRLREITINDFVFNSQYDTDSGRWNTAGLVFNVPGGRTGQMPVIGLNRGTVQYSKVMKGGAKIVTQIPIDAIFEPGEEAADTYSLRITTSKGPQAGRSTLTGIWQPGRITVTGGISSADVPSLATSWEIKTLAAELSYDANNTYSLQLRIKDLHSSDVPRGDTFIFDGPFLLKSRSVLDILQRLFVRFSPAGQIDLDLTAFGNLKHLGESQLNGKVYCKDVSILDVNFPYPVQHIAGEIEFSDKGVTLDNLSGKHNEVDLTFGGWSKDFGPAWQYQINIKSSNMTLDEDLYNALNPKQKKLWSDFSLSGLAAIDYTFSRQSQTEKKNVLKVDLLNAQATYKNFPYPLKNLAGDLLFEGDNIAVSDLVSRYDGRTITLNGKVTERSTDWPNYDITISAKDIPLESALAMALPAKQRSFYEQFDMTGLADAEVTVFTPEPNSGPTAFSADVSLNNASLKLEQLPLDVNDISAKAVVTGDSINIREFSGLYGASLISLSGRVWPTDKAEQNHYCLKLHAEQMELNDDLIKLLPESLGNLATDWQAKGKINIDANLNKDAPEDCPDYKLVVDCLGNSMNLSFAKDVSNQDDVNFKPSAYPIKDVTGKLIITNESIKLDNITANPDNEMQPTADSPAIKLNGEIGLADNAISGGKLTLSANDILFDERLGYALPEALRDLYIKLVPTGTFDLKLEDIKMSPAGDDQRNIAFSGNAKLKVCNLDIRPAVKELDVVLDMNGVYNTAGGFSEGRVSVFADSFKVGGKAISSLKAELNYDRGRRSWAADSFVGDCYGGKLTGKFEFNQPTEGPSEYQVQAGFDNIDLKQFLSEPNINQINTEALSDRVDYSQDTRQELQIDDATSGKMSGSLNIRAESGSGASRLGTCKLIITDMYVGKPSPIAKLLYVLKLTDSKDFVFKRMFVDSYIKNDSLVFEKFDLSGESLAFNGSGSMDLNNKQVNLALTVRGERLADAEPSVLQSLAENIGSGVVRMDVTGNAYDPDVKIKSLPAIRTPLKIFGKRPSNSD